MNGPGRVMLGGLYFSKKEKPLPTINCNTLPRVVEIFLWRTANQWYHTYMSEYIKYAAERTPKVIDGPQRHAEELIPAFALPQLKLLETVQELWDRGDTESLAELGFLQAMNGFGTHLRAVSEGPGLPTSLQEQLRGIERAHADIFAAANAAQRIAEQEQLSMFHNQFQERPGETDQENRGQAEQQRLRETIDQLVVLLHELTENPPEQPKTEHEHRPHS